MKKYVAMFIIGCIFLSGCGNTTTKENYVSESKEPIFNANGEIIGYSDGSINSNGVVRTETESDDSLFYSEESSEGVEETIESESESEEDYDIKYIDESEYPERMIADAHIADCTVLSVDNVKNSLGISGLPEDVIAVINKCASDKGYSSFSQKGYIEGEYNEYLNKEDQDIENFYLYTLDDVYFYCVEYVGDGAITYEVKGDWYKQEIGSMFGVSIP